MKTASILSALMLFAAIPGTTAQAHEGHGQPMYGGVVAEAMEAQFELLVKGDKMVVYVTQHGTPLSTAGASGKLTLLDGSTKTEAELKPAGDNRLETKARAPAGTKVLISIQLLGKNPLQGRVVAK